MWFEKLTGFKEKNPEQVRQNLVLEGNHIRSLVNGQRYRCGTLTIPTLQELKHTAPTKDQYQGQLQIAEVVADVQQLHQESNNRGALFQAASQFNLLEMVNPRVTPEDGIGIYEYDRTQGPACAIACGAGTIFRNYFVEIEGQRGQSKERQVDCLDEIGKALNNETLQLWDMQNGYALATEEGLKHISQHLQSLSKQDYEHLKDQLKIGIQWNTQVTVSQPQQIVSQAYCSALPVAYSFVKSNFWKDFAQLVLEATYEATFYAALKNYSETGNNKLFLTLVGGGAFGNELSWIFSAIKHAVEKFRHTPLDVKIVSYGRSKLSVKTFVESLK